MGKGFGHCASKQVRTELVVGLGNTYSFHMARKEPMEDWLTRVLYYMFYYDNNHCRPNNIGCDGILRGPRVNNICGWGIESQEWLCIDRQVDL